MDAATEAALANDKVIDITTTGRKSGEAKRIEIWFHRHDGRYFITGTPGRRSWYANLVAHPEFTFHLKTSHEADLRATARAVTEADERRALLKGLVAGINTETPLDEWVAGAPLVEVTFGG
jgi:deazaflavin-dependent oxidoreductase (nitroreductase family)